MNTAQHLPPQTPFPCPIWYLQRAPADGAPKRMCDFATNEPKTLVPQNDISAESLLVAGLLKCIGSVYLGDGSFSTALAASQTTCIVQ